MKNVLIFASLALVVLLGGAWWSNSLQEKEQQQLEAQINVEDIISRTGLHTHPTLAIFVNGEREPIPGDIGVGPQHAGAPTYDASMSMTAMHTHEPDGTIHLEFPKLVTKDDTKLKNFFAIWGREFMSFGDEVNMTVNGEDNTELGDYQMKDGDAIVLNYIN